MDATQNLLPIPEAPGYKVSDDGIIYNPKGRVVKQWLDGDRGTPRVEIRGRKFSVAHLVLTARTGVPPLGWFPRFANGDRTDCRYDNLGWMKSNGKIHR